MSEKKGLLAVALLFLAISLVADWKKEAAAGIADEMGYAQMVEALQKEFDSVPEAEKAALSVVIGYCHSRLQDLQAELSWMKRYLQEFRAAAVDLRALPLEARKRILKFKQAWQQDFPVLWELSLAGEQDEVAFFDPPPELRLRLHSSLACDFQLLGRDGALLAKGALGKGSETVKVPLEPDFFRTASHHFRLRLILRSVPERTVEKYIAIELQYRAPENALFDPQAAEVKFPGREVRPESETETRVITQRTRFDKEFFKKTVLKDILVGGAFFLLDATLLKSAVNSPDSSLYAKSALYGTRKAFRLAGIGFSLSALSKLPKAFKRERTVEEKTRILPGAREANEALKQDLARARREVRVRLSVREL